MKDLKTVHAAIQRAQTKRRLYGDNKTVIVTFRITEGMSDVAKPIIERHGITMSEFCRCCIECLIEDYGGAIDA